MRFDRIFAGVVESDGGVPTFNAVDVVQDRAVGVGESVGLMPLDIANPQGGFGQLRRVLVDLQAHHLGRVHQRRAGPAVKSDLIVDGLPLQVEQRFEGYVQEVAAAAGGVEGGNRRQATAEILGVDMARELSESGFSGLQDCQDCGP